MFSEFFNYDNSVWRFIAKFWDVLVLNILWTICCIPVFTVGASTTALYYVMLKIADDSDSHHFSQFFKSFKMNFKQSTIIWLIMLAVGAVIAVDIRFFSISGIVSGAVKNVIVYFFLVLAVAYAAVFLYVFPLQSRFYNKIKTTFANALLMSVKHFPQTLLMLAADALIIFVTITRFPLLILWEGGLIAFVNSFVFNRIFAKYMPEKKETDVEA